MTKSSTWEILFYKSDDWDIKINVIFENETIWLSQKQMWELFWVETPAINKHLTNIYSEWEVLEESTISKMEIVQKEWEREVKREVSFYNLDAIIAVWYRVNSYKATKFRIWATNVLKEYVIKWFVMDDERLKNWSHFWKDYFDELLARIREIRASERRFYQKITDIYSTSNDYDPNSQISREFFAEVQNKFLYAVSHNTATELINSRVNSNEPNMWLTSWKWQKTWWKIVKTDIKIWKNYLREEEIDTLNLLVSWYLDFAELQAKKGKVMYMKDWVEKTRNFLELNDMELLEWKWSISKEIADKKAVEEFEKFRVEQDKNYIWDFDKFVQEVGHKKLK
jgi:hypothetical protein